jgi:hypothetical protein
LEILGLDKDQGSLAEMAREAYCVKKRMDGADKSQMKKIVAVLEKEESGESGIEEPDSESTAAWESLV